MLFPEVPRNANDIRAFCSRFNEGIRVEYKSTFDENVRRALPKILSSFANSLGGVLIIGVQAQDGVPQNPVEGFVSAEEELPLTIENICIQAINPPVFPRVHIIQSDAAGRVFVVVEVDESWEAPHAIENSRRVYVRTGSAANPYDLAEVDLIMELVRRRSEPRALRERMLQAAGERANMVVASGRAHVEASIAPLYPRRPLCTRDVTWEFLSTQTYRGVHFFTFDTLRRVEDGSASFGPVEYGQLNTFGVGLGRKLLQARGDGFLYIADPFHLLLKLLIAEDRFLRSVGFRGSVEISLTLRNIRDSRLLFMPEVIVGTLDQNEYRSYENNVTGALIGAAENLGNDMAVNLQALFSQVCWAFWQSPSQFPGGRLRQYIGRLVQEMGQR
jgi:hypothetical protein